jgi:hypothetical protein
LGGHFGPFGGGRKIHRSFEHPIRECVRPRERRRTNVGRCISRIVLFSNFYDSAAPRKDGTRIITDLLDDIYANNLCNCHVTVVFCLVCSRWTLALENIT